MAMARGRSWGFDRERALEQAMMLFWERGFGGASYTTLLSAMAVPHPNSLVAAFGPKAKLFEAALAAYWERHLGPVLACLDADDPIAAFDSLLDQAARLYTAASPARGCLILTSLVNGRPEDAGVTKLVAAYRARISDAIAGRLARAAANGHLSPTLVPALTELILTTLCGIALRAQSGAHYEALVLGIDTVIEPLKAEI
ncbi:TetR/AcrR family transcriptional regulator [Methylobacterium radiotolerans]|uniref:TetR/AcrR family transcriptional regulator n=1 Tax=Methylobacterium radiotolerans TaxID=31998 RepID=UPI00111554F5|nr:TetR/AcrR family transcriptional regulator [Methylobacterium radiotolerans]